AATTAVSSSSKVRRGHPTTDPHSTTEALAVETLLVAEEDLLPFLFCPRFVAVCEEGEPSFANLLGRVVTFVRSDSSEETCFLQTAINHADGRKKVPCLTA